jgi:hypothetical protein
MAVVPFLLLISLRTVLLSGRQRYGLHPPRSAYLTAFASSISVSTR